MQVTRISTGLEVEFTEAEVVELQNLLIEATWARTAPGSRPLPTWVYQLEAATVAIHNDLVGSRDDL